MVNQQEERPSPLGVPRGNPHNPGGYANSNRVEAWVNNPWGHQPGLHDGAHPRGGDGRWHRGGRGGHSNRGGRGNQRGRDFGGDQNLDFYHNPFNRGNHRGRNRGRAGHYPRGSRGRGNLSSNGGGVDDYARGMADAFRFMGAGQNQASIKIEKDSGASQDNPDAALAATRGRTGTDATPSLNQNQGKQDTLKSSTDGNQSTLTSTVTKRKRGQDGAVEDTRAEDADKTNKRKKQDKQVQEIQYCRLCHTLGHCARSACKATEVHTFKKVKSVWEDIIGELDLFNRQPPETDLVQAQHAVYSWTQCWAKDVNEYIHDRDAYWTLLS
ncbi:hypothetical protein G647_03377, partial [Cladophialophora carrionii CBS 160.54]